MPTCCTILIDVVSAVKRPTRPRETSETRAQTYFCVLKTTLTPTLQKSYGTPPLALPDAPDPPSPRSPDPPHLPVPY